MEHVDKQGNIFIIMESNQVDIEQLLLQRLEKIGIEQNLIPGFIKDLSNSFFIDPEMDLVRAVSRLRYLGWDDFDLDYHTYQLAKECLENKGLGANGEHSKDR